MRLLPRVYSLPPKTADKMVSETLLPTNRQSAFSNSRTGDVGRSGGEPQGGIVELSIKLNMCERNYKFSAAELAVLRTDLQQTWTDNWQAAEMVTSFLIGRGYGVCREKAREAVERMETANCALESMQFELDSLALVM